MTKRNPDEPVHPYVAARMREAYLSGVPIVCIADAYRVSRPTATLYAHTRTQRCNLAIGPDGRRATTWKS